MINLTGGEERVIGNRGDEHTFRLSNPEGHEIVSADGQYEAKFYEKNKHAGSSVTLDTSELADGVLIFKITINDGTYQIRRLNPRRTLLTLQIEAK